MADAEYEKKYGKGPHFAADPVVLCEKHVLLITRKDGTLALPGGFMEPGEAYLQTAMRECFEETGFQLDSTWHTHPEVYGKKDRDPRSHVVTVAATFVVPREAVLEQPLKPQEEEVLAAAWYHIAELKDKVFYADHSKIITDALHRLHWI